MKLHAKLIDGQNLEFEIFKYPFTIGRSSQCDIVISHEGMSRRHCLIENRNGEIYITDLNSVNGVLVDGQKIAPGVPIYYTTFLSLGFGAVQSLYIEMDDVAPHDQIPVPQSPGLSKKVEGATVTKAMKPKPLELSTPVAGPSKKIIRETPRTKENRNAMVKIVSFLIILGIIVYMALTHEPVKPLEEDLPVRSKARTHDADYF